MWKTRWRKSTISLRRQATVQIQRRRGRGSPYSVPSFLESFRICPHFTCTYFFASSIPMSCSCSNVFISKWKLSNKLHVLTCIQISHYRFSRSKKASQTYVFCCSNYRRNRNGPWYSGGIHVPAFLVEFLRVVPIGDRYSKGSMCYSFVHIL